MNKLFLVCLFLFSSLFSQEVCNGTCFTDEEVKNLFINIQTLEQKDSLNLQIIDGLDEKIYMYIQSEELLNSQIIDYKKQITIKDEIIKEVEPKWYENKYLWFGFGVIFTASSVKMAGQIN